MLPAALNISYFYKCNLIAVIHLPVSTFVFLCFKFLIFASSDKAITICTSQKRSLTCSAPGSSIAITEVFWGRQSRDICPSDDGDEHVDCGAAKETPGIVRGMCQGKTACQLEAKHKLLQNPESRHCPGKNIVSQ